MPLILVVEKDEGRRLLSIHGGSIEVTMRRSGSVASSPALTDFFNVAADPAHGGIKMFTCWADRGSGHMTFGDLQEIMGYSARFCYR